jgi:hypothetical protein
MAAVVSLALTASCSEGTGPAGTAPIKLLVSSRATPSGTAAADVTITTGGSTMVITSVELVGRQIRLRRAGDDCDGSASGDGNECATFRLDPALLAVPLGDDATEVFEADVPGGSYDRIQFQIHKPTGANDAAFIAANPGWSGVSVKVVGSFNGAPFTYSTDLTVVETIDFDEPLLIEEGTALSVTLHVDVTRWFQVDGALVDPVALAGSQQLRSRIEQNIRASFRAFPDDDEDGLPE